MLHEGLDDLLHRVAAPTPDIQIGVQMDVHCHRVISYQDALTVLPPKQFNVHVHGSLAVKVERNLDGNGSRTEIHHAAGAAKAAGKALVETRLDPRRNKQAGNRSRPALGGVHRDSGVGNVPLRDCGGSMQREGRVDSYREGCSARERVPEILCAYAEGHRDFQTGRQFHLIRDCGVLKRLYVRRAGGELDYLNRAEKQQLLLDLGVGRTASVAIDWLWHWISSSMSWAGAVRFRVGFKIATENARKEVVKTSRSSLQRSNQPWAIAIHCSSR